MKMTLAELQGGLEDGRLLSARHLASVDDDHLELRDKPRFADAWMASYSRVESAVASLSAGSRSAIDRIRETAYRETFDLSQSPDLAGYVSDDFGLISEAIVAGIDDPWVEGLLDCYISGRVPGGA